MKIIGITGGIGAGKSTVCNEFKKYGAVIVDADKISRQVSCQGGSAYREIIEFFGEGILDVNGDINRKALADIVFSDSEKLENLNRITHKHIFRKMEEEIAEAESELVILDVPLLFSADFGIKCDLKIAIISDEEKRIERVIKRDNTDRESVVKRIKAQLSEAEFREMADVCIENDEIDEMQKQVENIVEMVRR